ncbi:hypothetical protein I4U23_010582 [Adineta vaga]|nr:hypothetical protein I4U23_010582 [Adineta vaga]
MNIILWSCLIILIMISMTYELNCIICSSTTNINCYDPYKGDLSTTSTLSQSGFKSCRVSHIFM